MFKNLFTSLSRRLRRSSPATGPAYRTPGVYIEELSPVVRRIDGADLSAAAFVGLAAQGAVGTAVAIASPEEFTRVFGSGAAGHLADAARAFFACGGRRLYVLRLAGLPSSGSDTETALAVLDALPDVGMLALPGVTAAAVLDAAARYCERRRQVLLLADAPQPAGSLAAVRTHVQSLGASSHVALYHPWLQPAAGVNSMPPSGALSGLLARQELSGGIWKAPAGVDATLAGVAGLDVAFSDADIGALTQLSVNPVRTLSSGSVVAWGARTLAAQSEFRYLNVRRFTSFVEVSVERGTAWTVFESNGEPLWAQLRASVEDFLLQQWRAGALQGSKPDEAFFVRCDRSTMTQQDLDLGRLVVEIGIAPLRPAEFIVLRIVQKTG